MAGTPLYADISSFQGVIDWQKYTAWAKQFDGTARICMKATEGVGFTDPRFQANRAGALAAGVDSIIFYHYGRPDLNGAVNEANWFFQVVGNIRAQDVLMLDYEQNTSAATAQWALDFLTRIEELTGRTPTIYASTSFVKAHLQDQRISRFPLILANWTYDANARPPCPAPWTSYLALQYSDRASIPGIAGQVDANIYLGGATTSTTIELANFPMISQRDSDKNADFDCVPASIAACLEWLTGKPYTASEIKDAVYGAGYVGGTAATTYVDYCAAHGVTLAPINGTGPALVTAIRGALAEQHPCLITEPDPYAAGWTHVCAVYKCDATSITVMDPWIDAPVTKTDAQWASQLQFNQIWTLKRSDMIPTGWKTETVNGVQRLVAPNGHYAIAGFAAAIENAPNWNPANTPNEEEYTTPQVLLHNASVGGGSRQTYRDGFFWWTQAKGVVWEPFPGLELKSCYDLIAAQQAQIATLKTQQPTPAPVDTTQAVADVQAIADAVGQAAGAAIAKAVLAIQKL